MKSKFLYSILLTSSVVIFSACTKTVEIDSEGGMTTHEDKIVTEKVTYEKDDQIFEIELNKLKKTYTIESETGISDEDEYIDFFGDQITSAPFLINTVCSIFTQALFNPQSLTDDEESAKPITEESEYQSIVGDYKPERLKLSFIDMESLEPIATCKSVESGFENIKFEVFRDYSDVGSMFGMEIGKIPEDN